MTQTTAFPFDRLAVTETPPAAPVTPAVAIEPVVVKPGYMKPIFATLGVHLGTAVVAAIVLLIPAIVFFGEKAENLSVGATFGIALVQQILTLAFLPILARINGTSLTELLALKRPQGGRRANRLIVIFALILMLVGGLVALAVLNYPQGSNSPVGSAASIAGLKGLAWWSAIAAIVLAAPIGEELLFRGYLVSRLSASKLGTTGAIWISSLLFALAHLNYPLLGMAFIGGLGAALALVRIRSGSIWPSISLHILWNSFIVLMSLGPITMMPTPGNMFLRCIICALKLCP